MKKLTLAALALCLVPGIALACDDHIGKCEIEDWKHAYSGSLEALYIDGVATCDEGKIRLRFYDGEGKARKFIGVDTAYIEGHIFQATKFRVSKPRVLSIKYSIDPG